MVIWFGGFCQWFVGSSKDVCCARNVFLCFWCLLLCFGCIWLYGVVQFVSVEYIHNLFIPSYGDGVVDGVE